MPSWNGDAMSERGCGMRLDVSPEAENDLLEAIDWYEEQRPGLGPRLEAAFLKATRRLKQFPHSAQEIDFQCRGLLLADFPYLVVYRIEDDAITIHGFLHSSRDRAAIKRRLPDME
jgi:plasmid stabilization system protein ParE